MEKDTIHQKLFAVKEKGIKLQRDTTAYNYKYATLDQIQEKLGKVLEQQKLVIVHRVVGGEVNTYIKDIESGDSVSSSIPLTEGIKAQDKGSEITYFRRYNLLCLLDLEVEDDDGKKAQDSTPNTDDNKSWMNDTEFEVFIKYAKENFSDVEEAIKTGRKKYKISKKTEQSIRDVYADIQ